MTIKVAINGFGRIGRNFMRCWLSRGANTGIELVGINGSGDTYTNAHLLKYDSMLGPLRNAEVTTTDDTIVVNGKTIKTFYDRNPANLPWKEWGVDLVIESTGVFNDDVGASKHFEAGAKKVILTAPGKGAKVGTFVVGVNADQYRHEDWDILSNASCTTNCMAPIVKTIDQAFGIVKGTMTTTHSYTGDQRILDAAHRDLRRARAAAVNIVPTSTGAAKAVAHDAGRLRVGRQGLLGHLHPVDLVAVAPEGDLGHVVPPVAGRVRAGDVGRSSMRVRVALRVGAREPLGICDRSLARGPLEQRAGLGLGREDRRRLRPGAVPADARPVAVDEFAALRHGCERGVPFTFRQGLQSERSRL